MIFNLFLSSTKRNRYEVYFMQFSQYFRDASHKNALRLRYMIFKHCDKKLKGY